MMILLALFARHYSVARFAHTTRLEVNTLACLILSLDPYSFSGSELAHLRKILKDACLWKTAEVCAPLEDCSIFYGPRGLIWSV